MPGTSAMFAAGTAFRDRRDAGRQLAARFKCMGLLQPVVLALPRGGVPIGYEIATALDAPLDVLMVRKLGAPGYEELAIGAVMDGTTPRTVLNAEAIAELSVTPTYLAQECERQLREMERRRELYCSGQAPIPWRGRTVIVVDDGIATGSTVRVALQGLAAGGAARLIVGVPVAPAEPLALLSSDADEIVCLHTPAHFSSVGQFYATFDQTSDAEVIELLAARRSASTSAKA
ncbi:MAG: phosphoribosyltransferase [Steroidobacteraceae bacterium]